MDGRRTNRVPAAANCHFGHVIDLSEIRKLGYLASHVDLVAWIDRHSEAAIENEDAFGSNGFASASLSSS